MYLHVAVKNEIQVKIFKPRLAPNQEAWGTKGFEKQPRLKLFTSNMYNKNLVLAKWVGMIQVMEYGSTCINKCQ